MSEGVNGKIKVSEVLKNKMLLRNLVKTRHF